MQHSGSTTTGSPSLNLVGLRRHSCNTRDDVEWLLATGVCQWSRQGENDRQMLFAAATSHKQTTTTTTRVIDEEEPLYKGPISLVS